jgi:cytoskeletal protein CcmA (bactofilin family)
MGAASLAIDLGKIYLMKSRLQFALDAAALAGAAQLPGDPNGARNAAIAMALKNNVIIDSSNITVNNDKIGIVVQKPVENVFIISFLSHVTNEFNAIRIERIVMAQAVTTAPSPVFDYAYFINNWGWFYGSSINANGDVRSNGDFDIRYNPRVNGHIYAHLDIRGTCQGKGNQAAYRHAHSAKLPMPNLMDLTYYEQLATTKNGMLTIAGQTVINKVLGDDVGEAQNLYLEGTSSNPIVIDGPVVVRGDVIIKGTVKGQGTIYAGRNIYIAGDVKYKNAPNSPRPANDNRSTVDGWVRAHRDKDMIGLAARQSIIMGNYTSSTWRRNVPTYLFTMGNEDVGVDGIPGTRDPGERDGRFDQAHEDLDGDGIFRNYNYGWNDVNIQTNIRNFARCPAGVTSYNQVSTNSINKLEGILYTNHALAGLVGYNGGLTTNGSLVSKDESIVYYTRLTMNYDERAHSRYRSDPNWLIDLGLPIGQTKLRLSGCAYMP